LVRSSINGNGNQNQTISFSEPLLITNISANLNNIRVDFDKFTGASVLFFKFFSGSLELGSGTLTSIRIPLFQQINPFTIPQNVLLETSFGIFVCGFLCHNLALSPCIFCA